MKTIKLSKRVANVCEDLDMKVRGSREMRDGSVAVYFYMPFGEGKATEARWEPRRPDRLCTYRMRYKNERSLAMEAVLVDVLRIEAIQK